MLNNRANCPIIMANLVNDWLKRRGSLKNISSYFLKFKYKKRENYFKMTPP